MPSVRKPAQRKRPPAEPVLSEQDFRSYLLQHAVRIAPEDVESLVAQETEVRRKSAHDWKDRERPQKQIELALDLLRDHVEHRSPQIPYYTVSLLATAVLYFLDRVGVIPDLIPGVGTSDDALMMELAFRLGAAGVERYCVSNGLPTDLVLGLPNHAS